MKKTLLAAALVMTSGIAMANPLNFSWSGQIPVVTPPTPGDFKFIDGTGADYVSSSTPVPLGFSLDSSSGDLTVTSTKDVSFYIVPTLDSNTLNGVEAWLVATPNSSGLVASKQLTLSNNTTPAVDQIAIIVNNKAMLAGAANAADIKTGFTSADQKQTSVNVSMAAKIGAGSFVEGNQIGFSTQVMFGVDLT
ncbi:hypothetical protein ACSZMN_20970 [Aeromonas veronii]